MQWIIFVDGAGPIQRPVSFRPESTTAQAKARRAQAAPSDLARRGDSSQSRGGNERISTASLIRSHRRTNQVRDVHETRLKRHFFALKRQNFSSSKVLIKCAIQEAHVVMFCLGTNHTRQRCCTTNSISGGQFLSHRDCNLD